MQSQALWPAPVETAPAPRTYVLEVEMKQFRSDGKTINCQHQQIALPAKHFFCADSGLIMAEETDNEYRKGLLQVKATVLKNDRLRVELIGVQTRARTQEDGRVALDLDAKQLIDRTMKLGKTVKKVLEKDNNGNPLKWVQLIVKEMPPAAMPPAGCRYTALAPALLPASPMPCQAGYPIMPPAVAPCVALQVHDEPNKSWELRAAVEEGNTKIALRQGDQQAMTVKSLEIKTENGPLEVTFCGEQIHLENRWLQACADALSSRAPDGRLLLEGHVNITYRQGDQHMVVTAERVFVDLASGHLQIEGQRSINSSREDLPR
jgi:hypothetical protein